MFISPDPIPAFRSQRGIFYKQEQIQWKDSIKKIQETYFSNKFRACAAICGHVLSAGQAHPLHEAYLHFYQAICHESLGLLAHKYSNNKLPLLYHAREHFSTALATLPLPYCTNAVGIYEGINESQDFDEPPTPSSIYDNTSPMPWTQLNIPESTSETASDEHSQDECSSSSSSKFEQYTFHQLDFNFDNPLDDEILPPCKLSTSQHARLSQSLSSTHILQEDLLPTPLFREGNTKKNAHVSTPLAPRSLPPIPSRDPLLRKTALQTLLNPSVFTILEASPITPRLQKIGDAFQPKFYQRAHETHLRRYNALLSSFRTQLLKHIADVDGRIATTTWLQAERQRNKTSRLASFWSVKQEDVEDREKRDRIERLRGRGWDVRKERHGWKGSEYYEELRARALGDAGC